MAFKRTAISFFELANSAYASSTVTFFAVDPTTNLALTTLITLYSAISGTSTAANPYALDSDGKFSSPVYAEDRFIAVVNDVDGQQHTTGIWEPALTQADVTAAAASATAAAVSSVSSGTSASAAGLSAAAAAASAALALTYAGSVKGAPGDTTPGPLSTKLNPTGLVDITFTLPVGNTVVNVNVPAASNLQAVAKASVTTALTPANLAALNGDSVTTGLMRFATAAEAAAQTITTAAITPATLGTAIANTVTLVSALTGTFTNVSSGSNVTMTKSLRYRFTATVAASVNFPTTTATNDVFFVEIACTTAATMTIGRGGHTIDGTAADDTCTRYGDVLAYVCTAAGVSMRSIHVAVLPT